LKTKTKVRLVSVAVLTAVLVVIASAAGAAASTSPAPVDLGDTASFAVLAQRGLTIAGGTKTVDLKGLDASGGMSTVNGDIGLGPNASITNPGNLTHNGTLHSDDAAAQAGFVSLTAAYNDAGGRTGAISINPQLGGQTLTPGVYKPSDGGTFMIDGTLTLDAQGDPEGTFIFQMGGQSGTLITAANSNVVLVNEAVFCRVFYQVSYMAELGPNSHLEGHVFCGAPESMGIMVAAGASVHGQLLSNWTVTLDNATVTQEVCYPPPYENEEGEKQEKAAAAPALPTTGLSAAGDTPDGRNVSWLLTASMFAVSLTLLCAAWRLHAASPRQG